MGERSERRTSSVDVSMVSEGKISYETNFFLRQLSENPNVLRSLSLQTCPFTSSLPHFLEPWPTRESSSEANGIYAHQQQISMFEQVIARSNSQPLVVNDIMQWFAFDSMGEFAFNENFGMMQSGEWHHAVTQQRSALALLGFLNPTIWIIRLAFAFAPFFWRAKDWTGMIAFCDIRMEQRLKVKGLSSILCVALLTDLVQTKVGEPGIAAWFISEMNSN